MSSLKLTNVEGIVAIDLANGLAKNGTIPWKSKTDIAFFKNKTTNHTVIMGSATLESLPNSKPLPNRTNIVITNNKEKYQNVYDNLVAYNLEEIVKLITTDKTTTFFIIGGNQIYNLLLPYCSTIWVTKINADYKCDTLLTYDLSSYVSNVIYKDTAIKIMRLT